MAWVSSPRLLVSPDFLQSVNVNILPRDDATYDLGSSSFRWKNGFIQNLVLNQGTLWFKTNTDQYWKFYYTKTDVEDGIEYIRLVGHNLEVYSLHDGVSVRFRLQSGQILPSVDNSFDLGSSSLRWKNGYFAGNLVSNGKLAVGTLSPDLIFEVRNDFDYSSYLTWAAFRNATDPTKMIGIGYDNNIDIGVIRSWQSGVGDKNLLVQGAAIILRGLTRPYSDNTYDLGHSSYRWKNGYFAGLLDIGSLQIGGTEVIDASRVLKNIDTFAQEFFSKVVSVGAGESGYSWMTYRYSQGNNSTMYYHKLGVVHPHAGDIVIKGELGGHTVAQGKSYIELIVSARDQIIILSRILGSPNNSNIEIYQDDSDNLHIYLVTGQWAQVHLWGYCTSANEAETYLVKNPTRTSTVPSGTKVYNLKADYDLKINYSGYTITKTTIPKTDNSYDLGSSSYKWKDIYFAGSLVGGVGNLGSLQIGGTVVIDDSRILKNIASIAQALNPSADNTYNLGSSSKRWKDIHAYKLYLYGLIDMTGSL